MSKDKLSLKFKKLLFKIKFLEAENEEVSALYKEFESDFYKEINYNQKEEEIIKDISNHIAQANSDFPRVDYAHKDENFDKEESVNKELDDISEKKEIPKKVKGLYRQIALMTHPDKYSESMSESIKKHFLGLYNKATTAIHDDEFYKIFNIAVELGLDLPEPDKDMIKTLSNGCKEYQKNIASFKNTFPWIWAKTPEEGKKQKIIQKFLNMKKS